MQIETTRFGRIEVSEEEVIRFPHGLYGLETLRDYCLLPHPGTGSFYWLQSVDAPDVALMITNPFRYCEAYEVEIPDPATDILSTAEASDLAVYTTVSVARDRTGVFTNLLGPLIINHDARVGMQLVLDGARYATRHPIGVAQPAREVA